MTTEDWEEFAAEIDKRIKQELLQQETEWDAKELNRCWNIWTTLVKNMMNKLISFTFTTPKNFYALSLKATHLHLALKSMNKCLRLLTTQPSPESLD